MKKYILTLILSLYAVYSGSATDPIKTTYLQEVIITYKAESEEIQIFNKMKELGYSDFDSKLMVAQARHESGNFKSRLYRKCSNAFGMMHSKRRLTTSLGALGRAEGRGGYAKYTDLEQSLIDALLMLKSKGCKFNFNSTDEYVSWLKSIGYFEATTASYSKAIKAHIKNIDKYKLI